MLALAFTRLRQIFFHSFSLQYPKIHFVHLVLDAKGYFFFDTYIFVEIWSNKNSRTNIVE